MCKIFIRIKYPKAFIIRFPFSRDACGEDTNTETCMIRLFRHALPDDVLIVGSVPANTEYFKKIQGNSWKGFHESA
jgi:hypothetical protein